MSARGKSKIEVEYIQDDRKRSDTLYKRRKGLVKKAYEISVMCGLKVSLFCTDFGKTCFSFCNDERLELDTEKLFKSTCKPFWINRFREEDYPFKSVKGEIREKLLFGKKIESSTNGIRNEQKSTLLENCPSLLTKRDFMQKVTKKDSFVTKAQESDQDGELEDRISKKLKIPPIGMDIGICLSSGGDSLKINTNFKNSKKIIRETLDDYLPMSVKALIRDIKSDPKKLNSFFKADPYFFEKLEQFNEYFLDSLTKTKYFTDHLILKNFVCMYFGGFQTAPMDKLLLIPRKEFVNLITNFGLLDEKIDKANEVLLHIISERIKPNRNFKFSLEIEKIGFCSKLYSFKMLNVRKMALGRLSAKRTCSSLKKPGKKQRFPPL